MVANFTLSVILNKIFLQENLLPLQVFMFVCFCFVFCLFFVLFCWLFFLMVLSNTNNFQIGLLNPTKGAKLVLPVPLRVDLEVMAMKEYSIFSRSPKLEPHHQMQFSIIPLFILLCISCNV